MEVYFEKRLNKEIDNFFFKARLICFRWCYSIERDSKLCSKIQTNKQKLHMTFSPTKGNDNYDVKSSVRLQWSLLGDLCIPKENPKDH